jgi:hypothetical protein
MTRQCPCIRTPERSTRLTGNSPERQVGAAGEWWQQSIDQYRAEMPGARTALFESGGHHVFLTNATEVAGFTLSFLAALPSR